MPGYTLRTTDNPLDNGRATDQNASVDNDVYFKDNLEIGGWIPHYSAGVAVTWTRAGANTFTVPGDLTALFQKGTKLKLTDTTTKYFYVVSSAFGAVTTVTITGGSDYALVGAITGGCYSYAENPQGFPDWFNWAPAIVGYSVLPTPSSYRFRVSGRTVMCSMQEGIGTSNATIATYTLPITANASGTWSGAIALVWNNGAGEICGGWSIWGATTPTKVDTYRNGGLNTWGAANGKSAWTNGCHLFYEMA